MRTQSTVEPTKFQQLLVKRAAAAADWLVRSIEACGGGSATFYSRWYHPLSGWSWPYPETTGYLIETLIRYAAFSGRRSFADLAVQQADWIRSLQEADGALPGGAVVDGRKEPPSVFNTGQMIFGLLAAADHTGEKRYLESARRAARWLAGQVDETGGTWTQHAYVSGFSPAYYTRVCWPMLEVHARAPDESIKAAAVRVLNTIAGWQQENGAILNWGFQPGKPAFTHTIAYTIRGFLESAQLLGHEGKRFAETAFKTADVLRRRTELRGRLAGAYDEKLQGVYWYACLTGHCQMAGIWMRLYDQTCDPRFFSTALKALQFVIARQRMHSIDPNVIGAIAGSSPRWGRYLTLRYPNWAAKFYLDALMGAHERLQRLLENGPCGLS